MGSFFVSVPNSKTHLGPRRSYTGTPSGDEEGRFCFACLQEAALRSTVLTEAPLFGAQKRAVRQAEGPLLRQNGA